MEQNHMNLGFTDTSLSLCLLVNSHGKTKRRINIII